MAEEETSPLRCPKCSSHDVYRFEMVHQSGSSDSTGGGLTLTQGGQGGEIGVIGGRGTTQTMLAQRCAPPKAPSILARSGGWLFLSLILIGGLIGSVFGFTVASVSAFGLVVWLMGMPWRKFGQYDSAVERWRRSWVCVHCGEEFEWAPIQKELSPAEMASQEFQREERRRKMWRDNLSLWFGLAAICAIPWLLERC